MTAPTITLTLTSNIRAAAAAGGAVIGIEKEMLLALVSAAEVSEHARLVDERDTAVATLCLIRDAAAKADDPTAAYVRSLNEACDKGLPFSEYPRPTRS